MKEGKQNFNRNWFALYVNVRHEKKVMQKLLEKGMEAYVPIIKQMRQWSDRKKMVEVPLFTGYVFVCLQSNEMDKPRWVEGVINYLRFEGKPAIIRNEEIEGLKYFVENGFSIVNYEQTLKPGQKVQIALAQFKDITAIVESGNGEDVWVSFEGLRQNLLVKVPVNALKVIG